METGLVSLQFFVDQPADWQALGRCVLIRGWCFAENKTSIPAIRLRTRDVTLSGKVGLPRPDVKAALPDAPDNHTGFEIRGMLPPGRHTLILEAGLPDGTWQAFFTQAVKIKRPWWPRWLGGGSVTELICFQMPAHMAHPATTVRHESFPLGKAISPRPKFSVVTPSYNQARFLAETMRSVLEQAAAVDYVVQDGGSADESAGIIRRFAAGGERRKEKGAGFEKQTPAYREQSQITRNSSTPPPSSLLPSPGSPRLLSWTSERDAGQADAIAKGFAKTSGGPDDIMAWINSDDFYLPGALGFVADYFARHPEVDVVYGHRVVVDENSREIGRWFLPKHDAEVLRLNDFVPQETLFWRRRIWDRAGGIDPAFKFALDWDLLLRFQAAGAKIVRVPYFLACFRIHAAQKTSAQMHDVGQREITLLRERTHGRAFPPQELEKNPRLLRYLRKSAFIEFLWKLGLRAP